MKETIPAANAVNRETDSFMTVYKSSGGGMGRRGIVRLLAFVLVLSPVMLAKGGAQTSADPALIEAIRAFEAALKDRDVARAMAAWTFPSEEAREAEESNLRNVLSAGQVSLTSDAPGLSADGLAGATLGTLARISEPRGSMEQWGLLWRKTNAGWRIASKEVFGGLDSLVHLTLDPRGYVANGQTIELEDFTLRMAEGTFFLNTQEAGPTSLTFVGRGRVTFKPRPAVERGQMKIFARNEVLEDDVSRAFLRLHPADLYKFLKPGAFTDDPESPRRFGRASDFFDRHKGDAFVLDAPVAGAPWWLLPGMGDASIVFETKRYGTLTLSLASFEAEGVSLFNRASQRQISVYPRADAPTDSGESPLDVLHHDLALTLNPETFEISGRDTVTIEVKSPMTSFRFRLDDDLRIRSVRSTEGGRHLVFRVRGQNSVLVSLGPLSGRVGRLHLTVEYAGRLATGTIESEILQMGQDIVGEEQPAFFIDPALVYSRRRWFYPDFGEEDYAASTLKVSVPVEWNVVSGGVRTESVEGGQRTVTHDQALAAKYVAFVAARMTAVASERTAALAFEGWSQARARREAVRAVGHLKAATALYTSLFGPLPYSPLNLAVIEAQTPGGHSPPGLVILQQRPALLGAQLKDDPATFYEIPGFFLAHELAHQWWGQGVTPKSYRDRWISEGFAQYAAALWTRESQGEEAFNRVLRKLATWARRLGSLGPVGLGNRVGHIGNNPQANRAVVYNKGALVLDMVRRLIGDEAFGRGLKALQAENRFRPVDTETVRRAFETAGGADLDALWETFVRTTAVPTMKIASLNGGHEIVVEGYSGPLPVMVRVGREMRQMVVQGRAPIPDVPAGARIELDPEGISLVRGGR